MEFESILVKFDEKDKYETPKKFNYEEINNRVHKILVELSEEFGKIFEISEGFSIQDVSFHADIILKLYP
jgi:hypothetical protein